MYTGLKAMIGKLNTVDCVIEVHDARIPLIGRNTEFRQHLGLIKPHILVLNKSDLADLSHWNQIEKRLNEAGDRNIFLTDLSGTEFSFGNRGYTKLMERVVKLVNQTDAFNRQNSNDYRVMICGIPNVGKSTLINRLRQYHLGLKGAPAKVGPQAGVTRHVENIIKICARPPVYSLDTPGVLEPGGLKSRKHQMALALCSTISDRVLNPEILATYLLEFLNKTNNFTYKEVYCLEEAITKPEKLYLSPVFRGNAIHTVRNVENNQSVQKPDIQRMCWKFIKDFREGLFGKVIFDHTG